MDHIPEPADNGGPTKLSAKAQNDRRWESFKGEVRVFYLVLGNSLDKTREMIADKYGFKASIRKWKMKLSEWRFAKYKTALTKASSTGQGKRKFEREPATMLQVEIGMREVHLPCKKRKIAPPETSEGLSPMLTTSVELLHDTAVTKQNAARPKARDVQEWTNGNESLEEHMDKESNIVFLSTYDELPPWYMNWDELNHDIAAAEKVIAQLKARGTQEWRHQKASLDRYKISIKNSSLKGLVCDVDETRGDRTNEECQRGRQFIPNWEEKSSLSAHPPRSILNGSQAPLTEEMLLLSNYVLDGISKLVSHHTESVLMENTSDVSSNKYGVTYSVSDITGVSYAAIFDSLMAAMSR